MELDYQNPYKAARYAVGMSKERAAEMLRCSCSSVSDYEQDIREPPSGIRRQMAQIYNAPYLELVAEEREDSFLSPYISGDRAKDDAARRLTRFLLEQRDVVNRMHLIEKEAYQGRLSPESVKEMKEYAGAILELAI